MNRRGFLSLLGALVAAPWVRRAEAVDKKCLEERRWVEEHVAGIRYVIIYDDQSQRMRFFPYASS